MSFKEIYSWHVIFVVFGRFSHRLSLMDQVKFQWKVTGIILLFYLKQMSMEKISFIRYESWELVCNRFLTLHSFWVAIRLVHVFFFFFFSFWSNSPWKLTDKNGVILCVTWLLCILQARKAKIHTFITLILVMVLTWNLDQ